MKWYETRGEYHSKSAVKVLGKGREMSEIRLATRKNLWDRLVIRLNKIYIWA